MKEFVAERFSRRSAVALGLIAATYGVVWFFNPQLIDLERGRVDVLLIGIWTVMTVLMTWNVDPRHDLKLIVVGLAGGLTIEWWGTNTELWTYYTRERPPLWIIPAWPIAALTIDRMTVLATKLLPALENTARAYWVVVPAFIVAMTAFLWPSIEQPASWVVVAIMLVVLVAAPRTEWDMPLFIVGATWGIGLEYWGTSRGCWTYYTTEIPPWEAVLAHGFASIAFARGVQLLDYVDGALGFGTGEPDGAGAQLDGVHGSK